MGTMSGRLRGQVRRRRAWMSIPTGGATSKFVARDARPRSMRLLQSILGVDLRNQLCLATFTLFAQGAASHDQARTVDGRHLDPFRLWRKQFIEPQRALTG